MKFLFKFLWMSLALLPALSHAELILLKKSKGTLNTIDYKTLSDLERLEIKSIYDDILMRYQFPMISMYFSSMPLTNRDQIKALLTPSADRFPEEELVNAILQKQYGKTYQVKYVPDTLFEANAITSLFEDIDDNVVSGGADLDKHIFKNFHYSFASDLVGRFWKFYQKSQNQTALTPEQMHSALLISSYRDLNLDNTVVDLYFRASNDLWKKYGQDLQARNFSAVLENIIDNFDADKMITIVEGKAKLLVNRFDGGAKNYINTIFQGDRGKHLLLSYMKREIEAALNGNVLLSRGTRGLSINKNQSLLDLPYLELGDDYNSLSINRPDLRAAFAKRFNVIEPDQLKLSVKADSFKPFSLSFARSLLAGTIFEMSTAMHTGARSLDFTVDSDAMAYAINIGIVEYLTSAVIQDAFFIPPLSTMVGLIGNGEFFHPRTKISLFHPNKTWVGSIGGYFATSSAPNRTFLADSSLNIGALTTTNKDWPTLASHITRIIGARAQALAFGHQFAHGNNIEVLKSNQTAVANFLQAVLTIKDGKLPQSDRNTLDKDVWSGLTKTSEMSRSPVDERIYQYNNSFYDIAKNLKNSSQLRTTLHFADDNSAVFDDAFKRTKVHMLAIPRRSYISLPHMVAHAESDEMRELFRAISKTVVKDNLITSGYRLIMNHAVSPNSATDNNANQEVPHFHIHIAGGECLGKNVVQKNAYMGMENVFDIFGLDLTSDEFITLIRRHQLASRTMSDGMEIVVYNVPTQYKEDIPLYVAATIIDKNGKIAYPSIDQFLSGAPTEHINTIMQVLVLLAKTVGVDKTGYRVIANHGADAWQAPRNVMQIFLVGGAPLGTTVTNALGNYEDQGERDFKDLNYMQHKNCPANVSVALEQISRAREHSSATVDLVIGFKNNASFLKHVSQTFTSLLAQSAKTRAPSKLSQRVHDSVEKFVASLQKPLPQKEKQFAQFKAKYLSQFPLSDDKLNEARTIFQGMALQREANFARYLNYQTSNQRRAEQEINDASEDAWIFVDSSALNSDVANAIIKMRQEGVNVLLMTNNNAFDVNAFAGLTLSNPTMLKAGFLPLSSNEAGAKRITFNDGILFCDARQKSKCLQDYLTAIANQNSAFPSHVMLVGHPSVTTPVRSMLANIKLPTLTINPVK